MYQYFCCLITFDLLGMSVAHGSQVEKPETADEIDEIATAGWWLGAKMAAIGQNPTAPK